MSAETSSAPGARAIGGIVLAGGRSSRYGRDKLAELLDGRPLLDHAIRAVRAVGPDVEVVVVTAPDGEIVVPPSVRVVRDASAFEGPLAGLATGLAALSPDVGRAIVVGGDMPSLVPAVLRHMLDALDGPGVLRTPGEPDPVALVVLASADETGVPRSRPLPMAVRPAPVAAAIAGLLGDGERRLRALAWSVDVRVVPHAEWRRLDPAGDSLRDVDVPADLPSPPDFPRVPAGPPRAAAPLGAASPDRDAVLRAVADDVVGLRPGRRIAVAIDGVDGAGKSVFADELAAHVAARRPVVRASEDDFHRPAADRYRRGRHDPEGFYRDSYDDAALRDRLLDPFRAGDAVVTGVFDHRADAPRLALPIVPPPDAVLILDGIFLHRPGFAERWDASVFLDVGFDVSIPRGAGRGEGDPDPDAASNRRYVEGQRRYLAEVVPRSRATWVIDNTDLGRPVVERRPGP